MKSKANELPRLFNYLMVNKLENILDSEETMEKYVDQNKLKIIATVDRSALIGRDAGYTIEWCVLGNSRGVGEKMSNAFSLQMCEVKALRLCVDKLIRLKETSSLPKSEILLISDSSYLVESVNTHLNVWSKNGFVKLNSKLSKHCEERKRIHCGLSKLK